MIVNIYFFKPELTKGINLVVLPKAIGRIPSACGSSVPACPILLILNRCDQWNKEEVEVLLSNIQKKLSFYKKRIDIHLAASSPRQARLKNDGTVRSEILSPKVQTFQSEA